MKLCSGRTDALEHLPDSLDQLHRQFAVHNVACSVEPFRATDLRTTEGIYISVLQNVILVSCIFLIFSYSCASLDIMCYV